MCRDGSCRSRCDVDWRVAGTAQGKPEQAQAVVLRLWSFFSHHPTLTLKRGRGGINIEVSIIKLKITNLLRHLCPTKTCMTAPRIIFPDQGEKWCRHSWKHKETIDISCTAYFMPHHEIWPKRRQRIIHVAMRTSGITAMPRSILLVSIWKSTSYLNRMYKQTGSSPFFSAFHTSYGRFCTSSDRCIGHISLL